MMSFPSDPAVGETHTFDNTVWTFNGQKWDRTIVGSGNSTDYSSNTYLVTTALLNRISNLENQLQTGFLLID